MLIARLLDRIPSVDTTQVEERVGQVTADAIAVVREAAARSGEGGLDPDGLSVRMGNTVRKLVGAAARLEGRSAATLEDVRTAWRMISYKLEMVRFLCGETAGVMPLGPREEAVRRAERAREARFREVLLRFGGLRVTAAQIAGPLGFNEKLVRRELRQRGIGQEGGVFVVPTALEWEERRRQASLQELLAPGGQAQPQDEEEGGRPDDEPPDTQDVLPMVPPAFDPVLTAFTRMADHTQREVSRQLCNLAFEEKVDWLTEARIKGIWSLMPEGEKMPALEFKRWVEWLMHQSWEARGLAGLSTYVASQLPDMESWLKDELKKRPDLPPRLRAGVETVIKVLRWHFEQDRKKLRGG